MSKRCCSCHKVKSLSEFHKNRSRSDGVANICKPCKLAYDKLYRAGLHKLKPKRKRRRRLKRKRIYIRKPQILCGHCVCYFPPRGRPSYLNRKYCKKCRPLVLEMLKARAKLRKCVVCGIKLPSNRTKFCSEECIKNRPDKKSKTQLRYERVEYEAWLKGKRNWWIYDPEVDDFVPKLPLKGDIENV